MDIVIGDWALLAGVVAIGLGVGALLLRLLGPARTRQLSVEDRVAAYLPGANTASAPASAEDNPLLGTARAAAAEILSRNRTLAERIANDLSAAGSRFRPTEWLLVHVAALLIAGLLGVLVGRGNIVVGVVFLAVGAIGPWVYLKVTRANRVRRFTAALPETLQLMAGSLSAGLSLSQSIDTIVREGGEPMSSEFRRVLVDTRLGISLEDALVRIAETFDSKDFAWVIMAIRIQREVGGNLAELLDTVAATMREREFLRRQVAALSAEGRISAWVLGALPPGFLLYLTVSQWDYVEPLFTDVRGIIMLVFATLWLGVGVFWMNKLTKVAV